jgi:hypothetical protein
MLSVIAFKTIEMLVIESRITITIIMIMTMTKLNHGLVRSSRKSFNVGWRNMNDFPRCCEVRFIQLILTIWDHRWTWRHEGARAQGHKGIGQSGRLKSALDPCFHIIRFNRI